jgi:branched-chain amino acid transport system permease protein
MLAVSGLFAGIAGALYAINYEIVTTVSLGYQASTMVLLMVYLGGRRQFLGPVVGAILIVFLQFQISKYSEVWLLYLGILFVVMIMFAPEGISGTVAAQLPYLRRERLHIALFNYLLFSVPAVVIAAATYVFVETAWSLSQQRDLVELPLFGTDLPVAGAPYALAISGAAIIAAIFGLRLAARLLKARQADLGRAREHDNAEHS